MGIRKEYKKYFDRQIKDECVHNADDVIKFAKYYKALSQHDVIKNEVAVCPECGCNKVQKLAGDNYSCMNAYCEWQTVL